MIKTDLSEIYRDYIACLNAQDWPKLAWFVDDDVHYNGRRVGISATARCWTDTIQFRTFISSFGC